MAGETPGGEGGEGNTGEIFGGRKAGGGWGRWGFVEFEPGLGVRGEDAEGSVFAGQDGVAFVDSGVLAGEELGPAIGDDFGEANFEGVAEGIWGTIGINGGGIGFDK